VVNRFSYTLTFVLAPSKITTIPSLPDYVLATNFTGLELKSVIDGIDQYQECSWSFLGDGIRGYSGLFFSTFGQEPCGNYTRENAFNHSCINQNNQIITTIVILATIQSDVSYTIRCFVDFTTIAYEDNINIRVKGIEPILTSDNVPILTHK